VNTRRIEFPEPSCIQSRILYYVSKSIRVEDDTHAALAALKGDNETFDDLLSRLIRERREAVDAGAGLWEGTDAAEKARKRREEMKRGVGSQ
jgi:predicted CopG family antitoxin